jgi:hypothetical protein
MISGLGVMSFRTSTRLLHFCAYRIEQSEIPGLLTQSPAQSQKILNGKLVANFLCLPTVIYAPLYDQRYRINDHWKLGCCRNSDLGRLRYLGKLGS